MDAFSFTIFKKISSRFVGTADRSSISIRLSFSIFNTCNNTNSDCSEWITMLVPVSKSILQSGIPDNNKEISDCFSNKWIFMVFSFPNLFFNASGESTVIIFPLSIIAISSQRYSASVRNVCCIKNC